MSHRVRHADWADIDLDVDAGRVFVQQRWVYDWLVMPPARAWTYMERRAFHHALDAQVWGAWSNRVVLNVRGEHPFCRERPTVQVEFDVRWSLRDAHWNVDVRKMPPGSDPTTFISNVEPDRRRIHIDTADVAAYRPQNAAGARRTFRALPHEFGHTMQNPDEYGPRSVFLADTDSIMNIGGRLRERHVHLLITELDRMMDGCVFSFGGPAVRRTQRAKPVPKQQPTNDAPPPDSAPSPPPSTPPPSSTPQAKTWFQLKIIDEVSEPVAGVPVTFAIAGTKKTVPTNGDGIARVDGVTGTSATADVSFDELRDAIHPLWKDPREGDEPKEADDLSLRRLTTPIDPIALTNEEPHTVAFLPAIVRVRLTGMYFDTAKCFILPSAMHGIRGIRRIYKRYPQGKLLVVGHTDAEGPTQYNMDLSLERADAVRAFLVNEVDTWKAFYGASKSYEKRWGTREDQYMLSALPEDGDKFYVGAPTGWADARTVKAIKAFQTANGLKADGVAGDETRQMLITKYMALSDTTLPDGVEIVEHGCGKSFLEVPTPDGVAEPRNRRVEIFVFDGPIRPQPQGKTSGPGAKDYPEWKRFVTETIDFDANAPDDDAFGTIHMQLFDETGVTARAGKSYTIEGEGRSLQGTTDGDGKLRHEDVPVGDYVLTLDGANETCGALVLTIDPDDPQIRFLG